MAIGDSSGFSTFGVYKRSRRIDFKSWHGTDIDKIDREASMEREDLSPEEELIQREEEEERKTHRQRGLKLLPAKLLEIAENKFSLKKSNFRGLHPSFYWGYRYYFFRRLLWMLDGCHREYEIENRRLSQVLSLIARNLSRWKAFTPRGLADLFHKDGQRLPKWQKGYRASFILDLFLHYSFTEGSVLLVAAEEGKAPRTIWDGIKKARAELRSMGFLR